MTLDNFPTTRPSFTANFARSQQMPPQSTFSRPSSGTNPSPGTVNGSNNIFLSDYNTARFNWKDGKCQGLLLEEGRTNLYTNSVPNNTWAVVETTLTQNAETAPDGTVTAGSFVPSQIETNHRFRPDRESATSGTAYTFSLYARADGYQRISIGRSNPSLEAIGGGDDVVCVFDLIDGTIVSDPQPPVNPTIESVGNGWYRCSTTMVAVSTGNTGMLVSIGEVSGTGTNFNFDGDGTSGVLAWGAQMEEGYYPTSYIPTSGTEATRAADTLTLDIADAWNADQQGTICTELFLNYRIQDNEDQPNNKSMWRLEDANGNNSYVGLVMRGQAGGDDGGDIRTKTYFPQVNGTKINNRQVFLPDTTGPNVLYKVAQTWFNGTNSATSLNEVGYQGVHYFRIDNNNETANTANAERIGGFIQPMTVSRMCIYNSYSNKDQQVGLTL